VKNDSSDSQYQFINRREFIIQASFVASSAFLASCGSLTATESVSNISSKNNKNISATFQLPLLGYTYNALEPYIDTQTMQIHHDKHHAAYVNNLNTALKNQAFATLPIEEVLRRINELPENIRTAVRNNGGGHANHTLFWQIMAPGGSKEPDGDLANALRSTFGSLDTFKTMFNDAGAKHFGSGWVWLVLDKNDKLVITSLPNQDNPLLDGNTPIMGNDVWEHAYYLKYQNRRADYLKAWWNVVNWDTIARRYAQAKQP